MKKVTLFLILISNLGFSQSLIKTYYDPLYKTKIKEVYQVKENTPYIHGYYKLYDKYGYLLEHSNYQNNKLNGKSTTYIGAYEGTITYGGKKNIGQILVISNYKNNELNGIQFRYNFTKEGNRYLQFKKTYENDILIHHIEYYSNGNEKLNMKIGRCFEYYENGVKQAEYISDENGLVQGIYTGWYDTGKLEVTGSYIDDKENGEWIIYNQDGSIKSKETYENGKRLPNEKEKIEELNRIKKEEQERVELEKQRKIEEENRKIEDYKRKVEKQKIKRINYINSLNEEFYIKKKSVEKAYSIIDSPLWPLEEEKEDAFDKFEKRKKHLYNAFLIYVEYIKQNINTIDLDKKEEFLNEGIILTKKMLELRNLETKEIEKLLKKEEDIMKIKSILNL